MVVREYDLPDVTVDILKRPHVYYDADELASASLEVHKSENQISRLKMPLPEQLGSTNSPKRLEKLFGKKSFTLSKRTNKESVNQSLFESPKAEFGSSSDMSLSDDSSSEWPFPYRSASMRDKTQPGSSFWDSDTSIQTPPLQTVVPDVAASADSTMISMRSRFSSSSSDSCASVPCRLVAESQPQEDLDDSEDPSHRLYTGRNTFTFLSYRRTTAPSYAQYLSLRKTSPVKRRSALSNMDRFADLSANKLTLKNHWHQSKTKQEIQLPDNLHSVSTGKNFTTSEPATHMPALPTNSASDSNKSDNNLKETLT